MEDPHSKGAWTWTELFFPVGRSAVLPVCQWSSRSTNTGKRAPRKCVKTMDVQSSVTVICIIIMTPAPPISPSIGSSQLRGKVVLAVGEFPDEQVSCCSQRRVQ